VIYAGEHEQHRVLGEISVVRRLRGRREDTRGAYAREYVRFRAFLGPRSLRTVGLGDLSNFAATLNGSPAPRRRTLMRAARCAAVPMAVRLGASLGAFAIHTRLRLTLIVDAPARGSLHADDAGLPATAATRRQRCE
jgi:hypothetical protein